MNTLKLNEACQRLMAVVEHINNTDQLLVALNHSGCADLFNQPLADIQEALAENEVAPSVTNNPPL